MAYVGLVSEAQVAPELQGLYQRLRAEYGAVPDYYRALGRSPQVAAAHQEFGQVVMEQGTLSLALKEQIALVVSGINSSSYCIAIHMEVLRRLGVERELGRLLATNYAGAPVGEKEKAVFRFADKLTRKPRDITRADVEGLRQAGWSEAEIFEVVLTVAWANFINRVSFGLGLVAGQA